MNVSKKINLTNLLSNAQSLLANETDLISGLANVAAVINACLTHIN
jgi:putative methionine-R-sulfoxide reductase with GAF domain